MANLCKKWVNIECEILKGYSEGELSQMRSEEYQDWIAEIKGWKSAD